jgi:hypothetical protein
VKRHGNTLSTLKITSAKDTQGRLRDATFAPRPSEPVYLALSEESRTQNLNIIAPTVSLQKTRGFVFRGNN